METSTILLIIVLSVGISLTITYFLIKAAVATGNKEILVQLKKSNYLKSLELQKNGISKNEIRESFKELSAIEYLKHELLYGKISKEQFDKYRSDLLFV